MSRRLALEIYQSLVAKQSKLIGVFFERKSVFHRFPVHKAVSLIPIGEKTLKVVSTSAVDDRRFLTKQIHQLISSLKSILGWTMDGRTQDCVIKLPDSVRGMKELDKNAFDITVSVPGWYVPISSVNRVSRLIRNAFFKAPGIKAVADLADDDPRKDTMKLFLFNPNKLEKLSLDILDKVKECGVDISPQDCHLTLKYENWWYGDILHAILPLDTDGVAGFSIIGHIVHLNLRENLLPYRNIIGEVILDKLSQVKTVVNKLNTIDNTYRNFEMELIAGEKNYITISKENGLQFELDFSKVYWNPRLGTEHHRIVSLLREGDVVFDVFAGIGPFAVPAAKKKCIVYANDLNPESYKWLKVNMTKNKVKGEHHEYNMDGREFIREVVRKKLLVIWKDRDTVEETNIHIVMNLPAMAVEFLDTLQGLFAEESVRPFIIPIVHCYCFCRGENLKQEAQDLSEKHLGHALPEVGRDIKVVRHVAPSKDMMCVTFRLEENILYNTVPTEPPEKKLKSSTD